MAKTTAKSKTEKAAKAPVAEKAAKAPAAKKTTAKATEPAKKKAAAKAPAKKPAAKKTTAAKTTDPGAELVKLCQQVVAKFDKMDGGQYDETKGKLEWCLGSYNYDKNPAGLVEYGNKAVAQLKEARAEKPRQVPQKLIDDLEKALAKF